MLRSAEAKLAKLPVVPTAVVLASNPEPALENVMVSVTESVVMVMPLPTKVNVSLVLSANTGD